MSTEKLTAMIRDHADKNSLYPLSPRDRSSANARAEGMASEIEREFIVIPRADLPEVKDRGEDVIEAEGVGGFVRAHSGWTPSQATAQARAWLAVAEYLANPPVDEAEVEALAQVICKVDDSWPEENLADMRPLDLARRLLATGRIEVKR